MGLGLQNGLGVGLVLQTRDRTGNKVINMYIRFAGGRQKPLGKS